MGYYEPDCDYFEPSEADIFFDGRNSWESWLTYYHKKEK